VTPDDSTTQLGLRWTQAVSSRLETWVGTDYARFLYDDIRRRERESVRLYYAGTLWRPCAGLEIGLDFEAEQNDTPSDEDPFFRLMTWVTYALP